MIEVPRHLAAHRWKLGLGVLLLLVCLLTLVDTPSSWTHAIALWAVFGIPGLLLIASNLRMLVVRPPQLRATSDGVAFAGGATIPWSEIDTIYEAGTPIERYGFSVRTKAIGFSLHRKRTLFRMPASVWLTTIAFGDVKVSTYAAADPPSVLALKLDRMRTRATQSPAADASEAPPPD